MRYTVILSTDGNWHLHRFGCADVQRRERKQANSITHFDAANLAAALDEIVDADMREMGYTHDHVDVYPCAKD